MRDVADVTTVLRAMWVVFGALVGACLGSFGNVVVSRVPRGQSIVSPPSRCPHCGVPIRAWQNIPILSWVVLRGRGACCGQPISPRYVALEVVGLILGWLVMVQFGPGPHAVLLGLTMLFLVCGALIDAEFFILPMSLTLTLIPLALLFGPMDLVWHTDVGVLDAVKSAWLRSGQGALVGFGVLWFFRHAATGLARKTGRIGPEEHAQGEGDEHLMAGVGAVLGPGGVWLALTLGSMVGAVWGIGVALVNRGKHEAPTPIVDPSGDDEDWTPPKGAMPFGPFLAVGAVLAIFLQPWVPMPDLGSLWELWTHPSAE